MEEESATMLLTGFQLSQLRLVTPIVFMGTTLHHYYQECIKIQSISVRI